MLEEDDVDWKLIYNIDEGDRIRNDEIIFSSRVPLILSVNF
jgi:hypothetical protein